MRILSYSFETSLQLSEPIREHDFVLRCQPRSSDGQIVLSTQTVVTPDVRLAEQTDGFGNALLVGRIAWDHDEFSFLSAGRVLVDRADPTPAPAHPMYRNPSALAHADAAIEEFASLVDGGSGGWDHAMEISHALHEQMTYEPGSTTTETDAPTAFAQRRGVCQDYAHILIAAMRSCGMAARYVNGLIVGEGATHAWVEVHDGTRWRGLDPTNDRVVDDSYIELAHGRDFADCPIESGVFFGGAQQSQTALVMVRDQSMAPAAASA